MGAAKKTPKKTPSKTPKTTARNKVSAPPAPIALPAFDAIIAAFSGGDGIELPAASRRAFGSNGLKVKGKLFAMLVKGALVVKLPRGRVEGLVGAGAGVHFDPGHGRLMKEWVSVRGREEEWLSLAREALAFVEAGR